MSPRVRQLATDIVEYLESDTCPDCRILALCEVEKLINERFAGHEDESSLRKRIEYLETHLGRKEEQVDELRFQAATRRRLAFST